MEPSECTRRQANIAPPRQAFLLTSISAVRQLEIRPYITLGTSNIMAGPVTIPPLMVPHPVAAAENAIRPLPPSGVAPRRATPTPRYRYIAGRSATWPIVREEDGMNELASATSVTGMTN
ncbi:MAG TPA: hypothetical protein VGC09_06310, partial [Rhodopila sp.]